MDHIIIVILLFFIYSFLGWIFEVTLEFLQNKRYINRGFLIGPYCPIYGVAILLILNISKSFSNPFFFFFFTMFLCGILEYITSFLLERIFHTRWWDYSNYRFHLNGRICLEALTLFGFSSLCIKYFVNPFFITILSYIPNSFLLCIAIFLMLVFFGDITFSLLILKKIPKSNHSQTDVTDVISKQVYQELKKSWQNLTK